MLVLRLLALSATTYGIDTGHMLHAKSEGVMHPQVAHVGKVLDSLVAGKATTDTKSDTRWTHGVLLCLLASTLSSLGVVIQKYAHNKTLEEGDVVECSSFSFYSKGWWIGGFCIWTTAQLINMCAMGLAPQTMLSCFGSWTIICNVLIARMILGELITSGEALGMLGILMGVVFVIMGAPHKILFFWSCASAGFTVCFAQLHLPHAWRRSQYVFAALLLSKGTPNSHGLVLGIRLRCIGRIFGAPVQMCIAHDSSCARRYAVSMAPRRGVLHYCLCSAGRLLRDSHSEPGPQELSSRRPRASVPLTGHACTNCDEWCFFQRVQPVLLQGTGGTIPCWCSNVNHFRGPGLHHPGKKWHS